MRYEHASEVQPAKMAVISTNQHTALPCKPRFVQKWTEKHQSKAKCMVDVYSTCRPVKDSYRGWAVSDRKAA